MLSILLLLCVLVWLPIFLYYLTDKGFAVLLIWLFVAPVAINAIDHPNRNPFFSPEVRLDYGERILWQQAQQEAKRAGRNRGGYVTGEATITVWELLNPTRLLFLTFLLVLLLDKYYKKSPLAPLSKTETLMAIFIVMLAINAILLSKRVPNSLKLATDAFFIPFLAYYVTRRFVKSETHFRQLSQMLIALGLMLIGIALIERFSHSELLYRLKGPFDHRNHFYVVMMSVFFMTLLYVIRYHSAPRQPVTLESACCWIILMMTPVLIIATWTRSNWLGFFAGVWGLLLFARHFIPRGNKLATIGLVALLVPLLVIGFQAAVPEEALDSRIANQSTIYSRIGAWILQLQEGLRHPLFGIGFNDVRDLLANNHIYFMGVRSLSSSHNCFLAFFTELGIVGLFLYLAILYSIIRAGLRRFRYSTRREDKWPGAFSIAILLAHMVPALTTIILYVPSVSHVYVFTCLGALAAVDSIKRVSVVRKVEQEAQAY